MLSWNGRLFAGQCLSPRRPVHSSLVLKISPFQSGLSPTTSDTHIIGSGFDDVALAHELLGESVLHQFVLDLSGDGVT